SASAGGQEAVSTGDGVHFRHWHDDNGGFTIDRTRVNPTDALGAPLPHEVAMYDLLEKLPGGPSHEGRYELRSASRFPDGVVAFDFHEPAVDRLLRIWCDPRVAYLPTRIALFETGVKPGEGIRDAARVVEIAYQSFPRDNTPIFYPVSGEDRVGGMFLM